MNVPSSALQQRSVNGPASSGLPVRPFRTLRSLRPQQADGLELLGSPLQPRDGFFAALRGAARLNLSGLGFVLLQAPAELAPADAEVTARLAQHAGLEDRLCIGVSHRHGDAAGLAAALSQAGLRVAVTEVDDSARLADIALEGACAMAVDAGLLARAAQDLRALCLLEALLGLAGNLGLVTLAGRAPAVACDPGFDYAVSDEMPDDLRISDATAAALPSRSRAEGPGARRGP